MKGEGSSARSKNILRPTTWNIKCTSNRDEIVKELSDKNVDICDLQETKNKGKGQLLLCNYCLAYSGVAKEK